MSEAFNRWYERNKALYNQKRQQKYRQSAGFRDSAIKRQKTYTVSKIDPVFKKLPDGREIKVYRLGQLKYLNGVTVAEVKLWESNGWIPPSQFGTQHRYYTEEQVDLIDRFKEFLEGNFKEKELAADAAQLRMAAWEELKLEVFNNWVR